MDHLRLRLDSPGRPGAPPVLRELRRRTGLRAGGPRIRCPRCRWRPSRHDRWVCQPGCGQVWNTFDTRARCPGCGHQWTMTACLACHEASPHEDWYEPAGDPGPPGPA